MNSTMDSGNHSCHAKIWKKKNQSKGFFRGFYSIIKKIFWLFYGDFSKYKSWSLDCQSKHTLYSDSVSILGGKKNLNHNRKVAFFIALTLLKLRFNLKLMIINFHMLASPVKTTLFFFYFNVDQKLQHWGKQPESYISHTFNG